MALKDPPDYVGLDPALIYGAHDLPAETYQRLLQLVGWMWVTRKTGNPLGTSIEELAGRWQIAERTVYYTLKLLSDKGYIAVAYDGGLALITKGPNCSIYNNTPGEPATHTQQATGGGAQQAARGGNTQVRAMALHENQENGGSRASRLHNPNSNSSVVVVVPHSKENPELQHQHSITPAQSAMQAAGVFTDKAQELGGDPWVTEERVTAWVENLKDDTAIRSLPAVLYANLKAHREPPKQESEEDRRWRHVLGGKYAELIQH